MDYIPVHTVCINHAITLHYVFIFLRFRLEWTVWIHFKFNALNTLNWTVAFILSWTPNKKIHSLSVLEQRIFSLLFRTGYFHTYVQIRIVCAPKIAFNSLPINFKMCFGCSKEPSHWDGSFEYPQHMFCLRNKKIWLFSTHSYLKAWTHWWKR